MSARILPRGSGISLLCSALVILLASSCSFFYSLSGEGKGSLSISLTSSLKGSARTVAADFTQEVDEVTVAVTGGDGSVSKTTVYDADDGSEDGVLSTASVTFTSICAGSCTVAIAALKDGVQLGSGSATVFLAVNGTVTVSVPVSFDQSAGTGDFSLDIAWPTATGSYASAVLDPDSSALPLTSSVTTDAGDASLSCANFAASGVSSGAHNLAITFYASDSDATIVGYALETVNIWNGILSEYWIDGDGEFQSRRAFDADELFDSTVSLASLEISGLDTGFTFDGGTTDTQDAGYTRGGYIGFVATRSVPGQSIAYSWNEADTGTTATAAAGDIDSGASSASLAVSAEATDGLGTNTLILRVTAPNKTGHRSYAISLRKAYTVTYVLNEGTWDGATRVEDQVIAMGATNSAPSSSTPERAGFTFEGWYPDSAFATKAWSFGVSAVSGDTRLYAKWTGSATFGVTISNPDYHSLTFAKAAVSILQGQPIAFETSDASLGAITSGWTWYIDGVDQGEESRRLALAPASTKGYLGDYIITANVDYEGISYSGSAKLSIDKCYPLSMASTSTGTAMTLTGLSTAIVSPYSVSYYDGYLYVADNANHRILQVDASTMAATVLAGSASVSGHADGIGTAASFESPFDIATDGVNLYVCDIGAHNIRQIVIASGVVTTIAGSTQGTAGYAAGTGTDTLFDQPHGLATDGANLYVCDWGNQVIRKIVIASGVVTTIAGTQGVAGNNDDTGLAATFNNPYRIAFDGENFYVTEYENNDVRKIDVSLAVTTLKTGFNHPAGITYDGSDLYVCDADSSNIYKLTTAGVSTQIATGTTFSFPKGITSDGSRLYVADTDSNQILTINN